MAEVIDDPFGEVARLSAMAWNTARLGRMARGFARSASRLATEAAALPVDGIKREVHSIRRSAAAAARHAARTEDAARRTADTLAGTVSAADPAAFRRGGRRTGHEAERARRAIVRTHRHAAAAGRLAAGLAALHESPEGSEPLWSEARELLRRLPLGYAGDDELVLADAFGRGRAMIAGLVAHAGWQAPAFVVLSTDDGRNRFVQLRVDDDGVVLESPSDPFLGGDDGLTGVEVAALEALGFQPPDGAHSLWWSVVDASAGEVAELVLATFAQVHGATGDDALEVTIAHAPDHPANEPEQHPAALDVDHGCLPDVAAALADRLRGWIDELGVDSVWATVHQPSSPYFAHLGSNLDGSLYTEVVGNELLAVDERLDERQRAQLRALGWGDPVGPAAEGLANHERVWPAPFDLDAACWHVVLTLLSVYGFDLDDPVLVTVEPFVTSETS